MLRLLLPFLLVSSSVDESPADLVASELRDSRDPASPSDSEIALRIAGGGIDVLEPALQILEQCTVPPLGDEGPQILSRPQRQILLDVLSHLEGELVRDRVMRWAVDTSDEDRRQAVLYALGRVGLDEDIDRVLELASPAEEESLSKRISTAFESALTGILQREQAGYTLLEKHLTNLPEDLRIPVVLSLGKAGDPEGVKLLLRLFDHERDLSVAALTQAGALGPSPSERVNSEFAARAREWLLSGTRTQSRAAAVFLAQLRDEQSIPYLIELLTAGTAGVRDNALFALQSLSSLQYPANPQLWDIWYQQELDWFRKSETRIRRHLRTANDALVAAAIQEISRHRLRRNDLASYLTPSLRHSKAHLRSLTCRALETIRSPESIPALVQALADKKPEVTAAAHRALQTVTGRDLPCDYATWAAAYPPSL